MKSVCIDYAANCDGLPTINIILASHPSSVPIERAREYPGFAVDSTTMIRSSNLTSCINEFVDGLAIVNQPYDATEESTQKIIKQTLLNGSCDNYKLYQAILESGFLKLQFAKPESADVIKAEIHFCEIMLSDILVIKMTGFNESASIALSQRDVVVSCKNQSVQKSYTIVGSNLHTDHVWYLKQELTID